MEVIPYSEEWKDKWDEFVWDSKNGGIFHTRRFLSYHPDERFQDVSLIFIRKNKICGVFPAADLGTEIFSHRGSTSGGLVVGKRNRLEFSLEMFRLLIDFYGRNRKICFRKHEYIFDGFPSGEVEFAAIQYGFQMAYTELSTCVVPGISEFNDDRKKAFNVPDKFVEISCLPDSTARFYDILEKNLKSKHRNTPTHTREEIELLQQLFPHKFRLYTYKYKNRIIGGVWLVKVNSHCWHTFYMATDYNYRKINPVTLIVSKIIADAETSGVKYLNFGISTEDKGSILNKGLFYFKESMGGFGVLRKMYVRQ